MEFTITLLWEVISANVEEMVKEELLDNQSLAEILGTIKKILD